jgi:tetratricopeptide (TPR) repeat protein
MNSLQLLITGNSPYNPDESQHNRSDSSSKTDYDLFLKILSILEPKDRVCSKFVSLLWCKAATQTLKFQCPLLEKLRPESIIDAMGGKENKEIISYTMPVVNNDEKLQQIADRLDDLQNDLTRLNRCKAKIKKGKFEEAIKMSSKILNVNLNNLITEEIELAIWEESKAMAEEGLFTEAIENANRIENDETRALAIDDIYDTEKESIRSKELTELRTYLDTNNKSQ